MSDKPPYKANPAVYDAIRFVLYTAYRMLFGFRYEGASRVPDLSDKRGVILAPNHTSFLDPPILGISLKRRVTYLAKEYLFRKLVVGWTLRSVGAYPIRTREDDFRTIRDLVRILREGRCIVVFPEGTRSADGQLKDAEPGVGFLALKSRAAVVPVYIRGAYEALPRNAKFFKCKPVSVHYGEAFVPAEDPAILADADPYGAVGKRILSEIAAIKDRVERQQKAKKV